MNHRLPGRSTNIPADKLFIEYTALAPTYEQRWSTYLDASLAMTVEVASRLPVSRVLDVACGTGLLLDKLAKHPDPQVLIGIDRVPAMLKVARQRPGQRALFVQCEATQLPFVASSFQLLTSTNALHYFPDVDAVLQEIRRTLSMDGHLVITDWCADYFWMRWLNRILPWTRHAHAHTLGLNELLHRLTGAGFVINGKTSRKINWFWGLMTVHARPGQTPDRANTECLR